MTNIGNIAVKTYFQEQNVWKPENESSRGLFEYNRKQKIKSCKHRVKFEPMNNKIIILIGSKNTHTRIPEAEYLSKL